MGLFSWLRPRRFTPVAIWLDDAGRAAALAQAVSGDLARGANVLVVAHFEDALVAAGQALGAAGVPFETLATWRPAANGSEPKARLVLARALPEPAAQPSTSLPPIGEATMVVRAVELHVLSAANERLRAFAAGQAPPAGLEVGVSLDDPVLQVFGKAWVRPMMAGLGMRDGEAIRSPMVDRAIDRAVRKLERRVVGDRPATSLADWMQRNVQA